MKRGITMILFGGMLEGAIVGAVIGAVVGVIMFIAKKMKKDE